jgi:hypothetical protein
LGGGSGPGGVQVEVTPTPPSAGADGPGRLLLATPHACAARHATAATCFAPQRDCRHAGRGVAAPAPDPTAYRGAGQLAGRRISTAPTWVEFGQRLRRWGSYMERGRGVWSAGCRGVRSSCPGWGRSRLLQRGVASIRPGCGRYAEKAGLLTGRPAYGFPDRGSGLLRRSNQVGGR